MHSASAGLNSPLVFHQKEHCHNQHDEQNDHHDQQHRHQLLQLSGGSLGRLRRGRRQLLGFNVIWAVVLAIVGYIVGDGGAADAAGNSAAGTCPPRIAISRMREASRIRVNSLGPAAGVGALLTLTAGCTSGGGGNDAAGGADCVGIRSGALPMGAAGSFAAPKAANVCVHTPGPGPCGGGGGASSLRGGGAFEGSSSI